MTEAEATADFELEQPGVRVPLAALHAERARRQAAERERDALRSRFVEEDDPPGDIGAGESDDVPPIATDQDHGSAEEAADMIQDERGPWQEGGDFGLDAMNEELNAAEAVARRAFGDDAVDAAEAWAEAAMQADPAFAAEVLRQPNPYAFVMGYAFAGGAPGPVNRARSSTNAPTAAYPPLSLVAAPSAGGATHVPIGPGEAYDTAFGR